MERKRSITSKNNSSPFISTPRGSFSTEGRTGGRPPSAQNGHPLHPNESQAIENLQKYLRQLSFFDDDIPPLTVDGIYEQATRDALTAFQRKKGLMPSGVANKETFDALYSEYLLSLEKNSMPSPMGIFPPVPYGYEIEIGEVGLPVYAIHHMLREINTRLYGDEPSFDPLYDVYDERTAEDIKMFQSRNRIFQEDGTPSGKTDAATWNMLILLYDKLFREVTE